jgi:hypothetical protein
MSEALSEAQRRRLAGQLHEKLRQDCDESESVGYPPPAISDHACRKRAGRSVRPRYHGSQNSGRVSKVA